MHNSSDFPSIAFVKTNLLKCRYPQSSLFSVHSFGCCAFCTTSPSECLPLHAMFSSIPPQVAAGSTQDWLRDREVCNKGDLEDVRHGKQSSVEMLEEAAINGDSIHGAVLVEVEDNEGKGSVPKMKRSFQYSDSGNYGNPKKYPKVLDQWLPEGGYSSTASGSGLTEKQRAAVPTLVPSVRDPVVPSLEAPDEGLSQVANAPDERASQDQLPDSLEEDPVNPPKP